MKPRCFCPSLLGWLFLSVLISGASATDAVSDLSAQYIDAYFRFYPTRATEAGQHELDWALGDYSEAKREDWLRFNHEILSRVKAASPSNADDQLDAEALIGQIEREINELETLRRLERDPLFWSSIIGNATVFLLVRDDLPLAERQERARARAAAIPKLTEQARQTFASAKPEDVAPDFCQIASNQLSSLARFYRDGFAIAAATSAQTGRPAADALEQLAKFFGELAQHASGSPRLGRDYPTTFHVGTRVDQPVAEILKSAEQDLVAKRSEAAAYGREVWSQLLPTETPPTDDATLLRRLFARIAADQPPDLETYIAHWRENVDRLEALVREKRIITLPEPRTLLIDRSPSYFVGQSVGGVYPAGPFAPDARTILFLPMPSERATAEERAAFFRDFNSHFNNMIVPHELLPGHYVQLKIAAHQPHKIRTLFPDPVYVEGWGTFCERLLLDQGWGGPGERLAHLKKQMENIARTVVDIRVHTQNASRADVIAYVKNEALQDDQFAANMWTRSITTSPQITTYYLGYRRVRDVYETAQRIDGEHFQLQRFMDGMMALGPVKLDHYFEQARAGKL